MSAIRLFQPNDEPPSASNRPSGSRRGRACLTGGDVIARYLDDLQARLVAGDIRPASAENHRRSLSEAPRYDGQPRYVGFAEIIGDVAVGDLIQHDLTDWLAANPQWASPETKRNNTAAAIACFNWAAEEGLIPWSPYKRSRRLKFERRTRRDVTDDEAERIWQAAPVPLRRLLWLVDRLGIRTCEARELRWDQIRWEQSVIVIRGNETKGGRLQKARGKKAKPRLIGIDPDALAELRRWSEEKRRHPVLVLVSAKGRPWTRRNLCDRMARLRADLGLPNDLTAYCFRHRYATDSRRSGVDGQDVTDQLGHSSRQITEDNYEHVDEDLIVREQAERYAKIARAAAAKRSKNKKEAAPLFDGVDGL